MKIKMKGFHRGLPVAVTYVNDNFNSGNEYISSECSLNTNNKEWFSVNRERLLKLGRAFAFDYPRGGVLGNINFDSKVQWNVKDLEASRV